MLGKKTIPAPVRYNCTASSTWGPSTIQLFAANNDIDFAINKVNDIDI